MPTDPGAAPVLVADGIQRRFGGLTAVDVDRLEVAAGLITALVGPNGAGKTTLFNVLTGFDKPQSGAWSLDGESLQGLPAYRIARKGLVRTFQLTKALGRMSVIDNMKLGAADQLGESFVRALVPPIWRRQDTEIEARADELLERFRLDKLRDEFAGTLSGGQRKLLEMARALMTRPRVLMLDEPMAGVNPALTQSLLGHIKALRDEGLTVVFVEHDMDVVRDIGERVIVMALGRVIAQGPPREILADQKVIDAYLGAHHDAPQTEADEQAMLADAETRIAEES